MSLKITKSNKKVPSLTLTVWLHHNTRFKISNKATIIEIKTNKKHNEKRKEKKHRISEKQNKYNQMK